MKLEFTGERFVPTEAGQLRLEHFHRYFAVREAARGKTVLDLACGEGYGSAMLAAVAQRVVGVDIDEVTVRHAAAEYPAANLVFSVGSATRIPVEDASFDLVVSFETVEHLAEQEEMVAEMRRVLRPDGALVISSPNRPVYRDQGDPENQFHVKELDFEEFDCLLRGRFPAIRYFGQRLAIGSLILPQDGPSGELRAWGDDARSPRPQIDSDPHPVYFVAACAATAAQVPGLDASFLQPAGTDLVKQYVGYAKWARQAAEELQRVSALYQNLSAEHEKVSRWAQSLDRDLAALREAGAHAPDAVRVAALEKAISDKLQLAQALAGERARVEPLQAESESLRARVGDLARQARAQESALATLRGTLGTVEALLEGARASQAWLRQRATSLADEAEGSRDSLATERAAHAALDSKTGALQAQVGALQATEAALRAEQAALRSSWSWRVTAPMRLALDAARGDFSAVKAAAGVAWLASARFVLRHLPVGEFDRRRLLAFGYARLPALFARSDRFVAWKVFAADVAALEGEITAGEAACGGLIGPGGTDRPVVSVVIPVYGQLAYTLRCLRSVLASRPRLPYEIVVVDDCSPDVSVEALARLPGIRVVGQDANGGFIRACNKGARAARGQYLLLLNNDTEVHPNWMESLHGTFGRFPRAGLAGSKLLYPDGRLQEAGGIIWNDASGWNYGRLDDQRKSEYNYLREVDYCSGASIMVRRDLFLELGGFDERYVPAYFEDADLAFALRDRGLRAMYQPASVVVHHEGITSGTDPGAGMKAWQAVNRGKFLAKWAARLATHRAPGEMPVLERDRFAKGHILVYDARTPQFDNDAGSVTAVYFLRIFVDMGFKVTFCPENMLHDGRHTVALEQAGVECLCAPQWPSLAAYLERHGDTFDYVMLYRVDVAAPVIEDVRRHCGRARLIFDTVDLHYLRLGRQALLDGSEDIARRAARTKAQEIGLMRECDVTIVLSETERAILQAEDPALRIATIPLLLEIPGCRRRFAERRDIVFIGGYEHTPNVDAVTWFVREIWPLARPRLPGVRFLMLGSRMPDSVRNLADDEGVVAVGFVPDLAEPFDACRLAVAPLRFGAGIKGKIGTSSSYGVPCVATSIAVEGMGMADGRDVVVADDAAAFADRVVALYTDEALWQSVSRGTLEFVDSHYSIARGREHLARLFDSLPPRSGPAS